MKRRAVISFILAVLCVSCTEEEKAFFGELSKDEISFNGAGNSSVQLSFKTNSQWKAVSSVFQRKESDKQFGAIITNISIS